MSQNHCLYCDKPLALLKRLTGDAEFCSKEHRKIYQQEHNQLALARLLASQPKEKQKPPLAKPQPVKPSPEIIAPIAEPEAPQPDRAGFLPDAWNARPSPGATRSASVPNFQGGAPVWKGVHAEHGRKPKPKTASFLPESANARTIAGKLRFQGKPTFKPSSISLGAKTAVLREPQPGAHGFVSEQFAAKVSTGKPRPPMGARFGPPARITTAPDVDFRICASSAPRLAKYLSGYTVPRTVADRIRAAAVETRWRPLSPALPAQLPGRIVLVLGSLLQRPVRPASHDQLPDVFKIPFQPFTFPQPSPGMGYLEERLHRTDRIGFSPP